MFTFKTQPQSVWGIIGDGFQLYGNSISKIWYWQTIFLLPIFILSTITTFFVGDQPQLFPTSFLVTLGIINLIFVMIISTFGNCFVFNRIHAIGTQGDTTIRSSLKIALRKTWPILGCIIFLFLLLAMIFIPIVMLLANTFQIVVAEFIALGVFAYLLTICLSIFIVLFPFFILFENRGMFRSLILSITHMWGNFWRTLFLLLLISVIFLAALLAIMMPMQIIITLASAASKTIGLALGDLLLPASYLVIYTFFVPLVNAVLLALFYDAKVRKGSRVSLIEQETK